MESIVELHQSKTALKPMLWLLGLVAAGMFYFVFFSHKAGSTPIKIFLLVGACLMGYTVWHTTLKLQKNEPLLTFYRQGLKINETTPVTLLWREITSWDVRKNDATYYLILEAKDKSRSINISWLEVSPEEVKSLMKSFTQPAATT